jgi:hypothetical protein
MRRVLAALAALAPTLAQACPVCATDQGRNAALYVGAMIAAPYVVAAVVIRAIRAGGDGP